MTDFLICVAAFTIPLAASEKEPPLFPPAPATTRASVASDGVDKPQDARYADISADGRWVVFATRSALVADDTNGAMDVYAHDRWTRQTVRASVGSDGGEGEHGSIAPAVSGDGRFVAFITENPFDPIDSPGSNDIYVRDMQDGVTEIVSVNSDGEIGGTASLIYYGPAISADGRYVVFEHPKQGLVDDDTDNTGDIFMRDRLFGETSIVSVSTSGAIANDTCIGATVSDDGRFVAYYSDADNLVEEDDNGLKDVFLHDRDTGETTLISLSTDGQQGNSISYLRPAISGDGRRVIFASVATNLVPDDENGDVDVFLRDLDRETTTRIVMGVDGAEPDGNSANPVLNSDDRFLCFISFASNLVPDDDNDDWDVFRLDLERMSMELLSRNTMGDLQDDPGSIGAQINFHPVAADNTGAIIAFTSRAANLVESETESGFDVFVRDLRGSFVAADLNGDLRVDANDLAVLLGAWGACSGGVGFEGCAADFNRDGAVGPADLAFLLGNFTS